MKALLLLVLPFLSYGQSKLGDTPLNSSVKKSDTLIVEFATLKRIADKYGVGDKMTFKPKPGRKEGEQTVALGMNLIQFEEMMKQFAFNERKVAIMNQFHLVDFQKVSTVAEYIALRRRYAKKYHEYLKDVPSFQEEEIKKEEERADEMSLNTPNFRKTKQ